MWGRFSTCGRFSIGLPEAGWNPFFALTAVALAHHSNVAFEVNTVITVTGVVKEFRWANPHTWVALTADDGKGGKVDWAIEGRAPGVLLRAGWTRSSLKPGDTIT